MFKTQTVSIKVALRIKKALQNTALYELGSFANMLEIMVVPYSRTCGVLLAVVSIDIAHNN